MNEDLPRGDGDLERDVMCEQRLKETSAALEECRGKRERLSKDLARQEERAKELEQLLFLNPDTLLPVRRIFEKRLEEMVEARSGSGTRFAIGILRLDQTYGRIKNTRDKSKALLFKSTLRIKEVIGENLYQSDRLDEFLLLLPEATQETAPGLVQELCKAVEQHHEGPAEDVHFGCRIGYSIFPEDGVVKEMLLGNADIALETAEVLNERSVRFHPDIGKKYHERMEIEKEFLAAVREGMSQFFLVFQPIVGKDRQVKGSEALVRWKHPRLGFIPPSTFIPIAEETGEIIALGQWVLYQACKQLKAWHAVGFDGLYVSVNLSPYQFRQADLEMRIFGTLRSIELDGGMVKLEITEGTVMEDPPESIRKLTELREGGVRISIDDFGMGYSSLSYLTRYPIDVIKIDKSFVDGLATSENSRAVIRAIIAMANSLGIETLAEGVETQEQLDFLLELGCMYIQGYYFSKPLPPPDFEALLAKGLGL